jgi:hypothetical protein
MGVAGGEVVDEFQYGTRTLSQLTKRSVGAKRSLSITEDFEQ